MKIASLAAVALAASCAGFASIAAADGPPPPGAMPLSRIIAMIEQRPDLAYIEQIELERGVYEIEYKTKDGREREIDVDPRTGAEVPRR
ncbi:MAG: PepSY domain-containing protein [Alphaproteobacteria bacterium]